MILLTSLLPHQTPAVDKLSKLKVGALYMEMGTGKSRVALELAARRLKESKIDHVLWLCPCSVQSSLRKELLKHTNDISKITICGIETLSSSVRKNEELLRLVKGKRVFLVVDESNLTKNFFAKRTQAVIRLSQLSSYRIILNGTPISRDQSDLFAQWFILDWRILGYRSYYSFSANHLEFYPDRPGKHVRVLNTDYLACKITPYSYQIRKSECLDLPSKTYKEVYFDLTRDQYRHYQVVFDHLLGKVDELRPETIYELLSAAQAVTSGYYFPRIQYLSDNGRIDKTDIKNKTRYFENDDNDPRLGMLKNVIGNISDEQKVVIFAKYTDEIDIIADMLNQNIGKAVKFNGEMRLRDRNKSIESFENGARFLVANKQTAGYGLNLQFCSYIIYYSNDWDWATREQSEDRVHRIGQKSNVHIIDIIAADTIDERILHNLACKTNIVDELKSNIDRLKDQRETGKVINEYIQEG